MPKLIPIRYKKRVLNFMAGPYMDRIEGTFGVKLAAEIKRACDLAVDIPDFGVPSAQVFENALIQTITAARAGHVVYIGCMGGIGRTGMMLAGLHRALKASEEDSVEWVRRVYLPHAVETDRQADLVRTYDLARVQNALHLDPDGKITLEEHLARFLSGLKRALRLESKAS